jgi:DNA primase
LTDYVIRQFRFGYCPASVYHELAGRIIMPLFNPYGEVVAITTRNPWTEKRWQHWHESFDKSYHLFGLNIAKSNIVRTDKAIVVEGQFDTTCLHSYGFNMTVGVLGSALSIFHIAQLARYCSEVYLLMDSDGSGDDGVARAYEAYETYCLQTYGIKFIALELPKGVDPDDFVRHRGGNALIEMMKKGKERLLNG